jgi:hypothetical protein
LPHDDLPRRIADAGGERRMMQCRMCSQRLTRPGKLCRECGHELERARFAGASVDDVAALPVIDASRMAGTEHGAGRFATLRSRASIITLAFTLGLVGATVLHLAQRPTATMTPGSVMLDRDLSNLHPRSFARASADAPASGTARLHDAPVQHAGPAEQPADAGADAARDNVPRGAAQRRVKLHVQPVSATDEGSNAADRSAPPVRDLRAQIVATPVASTEPRAGYDRVLAFADALARCGGETFFERIACEGRARMHHCSGALAQLPQCAGEFPRDHGQ